jgi:N utilization substance protein A
MTKKFDLETIQQINLFEKLTGAKLKDIILREETVSYIVQEGEIKKAIGKEGNNVRKLGRITRKRIKIIEFKPNPILFIKNLINPIKPKSIELSGSNIEIEADRKTKGLLIGKNQQNLKVFREILKDYFNLGIIIK